jgi:secondary thiamine-phosphate synthase enzyme
MENHARTITVSTRGRGTVDLTGEIQEFIAEAGVGAGLCNVFLHHTSASLIVCENADPSVRRDLERFAAKWVCDGDPMFEHSAEGPDDMSAHVRSVFTQASLTLPVAGGRCTLGTWQSVYLWEHRTHPHSRRVTLSVMGE